MAADALAVAARYVEIGRPELALRALSGLDADAAAHPDAWRLRGWALLTMKRFDDAAAAARDGLADAPADVALLHLLSVAEDERGDVAAAEAAILAALAEDPDDPELLCQYARVLMRGGALDKAARVLDAADASDPGSAGVLSTRISLAYLRHDDKAAKRLTEELLALDPEHVQAHRMLGTLAASHGDMATAAERFATAVRQDPENQDTADAARATRDMRSAFWAPTRFVTRFGAVQTWFAAMAVIYGLRAIGLTPVALVAAGCWLILCVWSWIGVAVASRRGW